MHQLRSKVARSKEEAKAKLVKKAQYAALVREMFSPAVDANKRKQIEDNKQKKGSHTAAHHLHASQSSSAAAGIVERTPKKIDKTQQTVIDLGEKIKELKQKAKEIEELSHRVGN